MKERLKYDLLAFSLYLLLITVFYTPVMLSNRSLLPSLYQPHGVVEGWPYGYEGRIPVNTFNIDLATPAYYEQPINKLVGGIYKDLELPLWNPFQGAGTPLAAQYSSRAFFPYQILEDVSPYWSWDYFLLGRLLLAGCFTYLFLRLTGLSFAASFLGGAVYMFSGTFTWFINLEQFANNAMTLPLLMYSLERLAKGYSARRIAFAGVSICLVILAGQPEVALYILFLGACYFVFRGLFFSGGMHLLKGVALLIASGVIGAALSAPLILPFLEFMGNSFHLHHAGGGMGVLHPSSPYQAFAIFAPSAFEFPMPPEGMAGVKTLAGDIFHFSYFPISGDWDFLGGYTGSTPVLIIAAALMAVFLRREARWSGFIFFFTAFGAFILFKNFGVKPFLLIGNLPFFDQVWSQRWAGPAWTFSLAVAAAFGAEILAGYPYYEGREGEADGPPTGLTPVKKILRRALEVVSSAKYLKYSVIHAVMVIFSLAIARNLYREWMRKVAGTPITPAEKSYINDTFVWAVLLFLALYALITLWRNRGLGYLRARGYFALVAVYSIAVNLVFMRKGAHVLIVQNIAVGTLAFTLVTFHALRRLISFEESLSLAGNIKALPSRHKAFAELAKIAKSPFFIPASGLLAVFLVFFYFALPAVVHVYTELGAQANGHFAILFPYAVAVALILQLAAFLVLAAGLKEKVSIPSLLIVVMLELWWAVPRGYPLDWLPMKFVPFFFGLSSALALLLRKSALAFIGAAIFLASFVLVDSNAQRGFPERYDPFAKAPYVDFLKERNPGHFRVIGEYGVLFPNFASAVGLQDIRYINALSPEAYQEFRLNHLHKDRISTRHSSSLWFTGRPELYTDIGMEAGGLPLAKRPVEEDLLYNLKGYSFLGVKYIVLPKGYGLNGQAGRGAGHAKERFPLIYDGEVNIYENVNVMPRAFIVNSFEYAPTYREAQKAFSRPEFDPLRKVILEERVPAYNGDREPRNEGDAYIRDYRTNEVVIEAESKGPGFLVLTDAYYPGWKAYVDGRFTKVYRANGVVRAVFLEGGRHEVVFKYRPWSFTAGLVISSLSMTVVGTLILISLKGGRHRVNP